MYFMFINLISYKNNSISKRIRKKKCFTYPLTKIRKNSIEINNVTKEILSNLKSGCKKL